MQILPDIDLPTNTFIVTDPPFGLEEENFNQVIEVVEYLSLFPQVIILDYRNSHLLGMQNKVGELIWEYGWVSGGRCKAKTGFFPTHNTIHLLGTKSNFRFIGGSIIHRQPGFSSPRQCSYAKKSGHPFEKPVKLMEYLIQGLVEPALIVDPFSGSGSTLVASKNLGIPYLGIEKQQKWVSIAKERLDA